MNSFDISVAVSPVTDSDPLKTELQLLKIALFYGDQVHFLGISSGFHSLFLGLDGLPIEDQIKRLVRVGASHPEHLYQLPANERRLFDLFSTYVLKMDAARKARSWSGQHEAIRRKFHTIWTNMQEERFRDPVFRQFRSARDSGLVKFKIIDQASSFKKQSDRFLAHVENEILSSLSYPLFDVLSGMLATYRMNTKGQEIPESARKALSHMGFVAHSLENLPTFESTSLEEVLDLRTEVEEHLGQFRAGMLEYSEQIQQVPWDESFGREAEMLFRRNVVSAVDKVAAAANQSGIIDATIRRTTENLGGTLSALGAISGGLAVALTPASLFHDVLASSLGWGTASIAAALFALGIEHERAKKQNEVESMQMYLYYKARKTLQEKQGGDRSEST